MASNESNFLKLNYFTKQEKKMSGRNHEFKQNKM